MATISTRKSTSQVIYSSEQSLCLIVGLACLAGFLVDSLILAVPLNPIDLQWRINFFQQMSDRSIILLFGLSLVIYGLLNNRKLRKRLSLICLLLGTAFVLSGVLVVRDNLKFQDLTLANITNQEVQVRTQIESAQADPASLAPEITPEALQQATQLLSERAETVKQNAKTGVLKVAASSVGNLLVIGIALIGIGRFGAQAGR